MQPAITYFVPQMKKKKKLSKTATKKALPSEEMRNNAYITTVCLIFTLLQLYNDIQNSWSLVLSGPKI